MKNLIPTVGVLVIRGNEVLLVKHTNKSGHLEFSYGLPSGRVEGIESEQDTAIRELHEETGLRVDPKNLILLPQKWTAEIKRSDGSIKNFSLVVFVTKTYSGDLMESEETVPEWVSCSQLLKLHLLPNVADIIEEGMKMKAL